MIKPFCFALMILLAFSLSAFALPAAELVPAVVQRDKIEQLRRAAVANMRSGNEEEAIRCYQEWCDLDPGDPLALKDLMWALMRCGRYEEAGISARGLLALRPYDYEGLDALARVPNETNCAYIEKLYFGKKGVSDDVPLYRKLAELVPADKRPSVMRHLLSGLYRHQNYPEGLKTAQYLATVQPGNHENWNWLARFQSGDRDYPGALKSLRTSLALNSNQPLVYASLGRVYIEMGDYKQAKRLCRDADNLKRLLKGLYQDRQYAEGLEAADYLVKIRPADYESWNWLGRMENGLGNYNAALRSYRKSLALHDDQPVIRVALARIYIEIREYDKARRLCQSLEKKGQLPETGYPLLGYTLFSLGQYEKSLPYWEKAVRLFPDSTMPPYYEACCLAMIGQTETAQIKMRSLYETRNFSRALMFLVDVAQSEGNTAVAIDLLEKRVWETGELRSADEALVMRLAGLYTSAGLEDRSIQLIREFLVADPDNQTALFRLAHAAFAKGNFDACEEYCRQMLKNNPSLENVYLLLAEALAAGGRRRDSERLFSRYLEFNSTDPLFVFSTARAAYAARDYRKAKTLVLEWLRDNQGGTVLPILLYHGLAVSRHDPKLAYSYHHHVEVFEDQMRALHAAGYTAVTVAQVEDWLRGRTELPPKPILITFDDGRVDSFLWGDPVLEKYGYKAVMFSALVNTSSTPNYFSLKRIKEYQDNGRWEIQSHGDQAHIFVPVSSGGDMGLFLLNRQWLEGEGRLETEGEWRERIEGDYQASREKLRMSIGQTPTAYAFPEGAFGQNYLRGNASGAAEENLRLVEKYFSSAYIQNECGMNMRTQNPWRLARLEPSNNWNGDELVRYLRNQSPFSRAYRLLLDWAVWEGRMHEALFWLRELKDIPVTPGELTLREAKIRMAAGDYNRAARLVRRAADLERIPEAQQLESTVAAAGRAAATPECHYEQDNYGRRNWIWDQTLDLGLAGAIQWGLHIRHGEYRQDLLPAAVDNAGGVSARMPLGFFHAVSAEVMAHALADYNTAAFNLSLHSAWTDDLNSTLNIGRALYGSPAAIHEHITCGCGDLQINWHGPYDEWRISGRGIWNELSDANRRLTARLEFSRELLDVPALRAVFRFTYDDMEYSDAGKYYSPQEARSNALGVDFSCALQPHLKATLRYLPAYHLERGYAPAINHEVNAKADWILGEQVTVVPAYHYYAAPGYQVSSGSLTCEVRF